MPKALRGEEALHNKKPWCVRQQYTRLVDDNNTFYDTYISTTKENREPARTATPSAQGRCMARRT